jgi:hypothetical protein
MSRTITPEQASAMYGLCKGTLANLRSQKKGCAYFTIGRKVLYRVDDFEKWLFQNPVETVDSIRG